MSYADRQIDVPHNLAVQHIRYLPDFQGLEGLPIGEHHPLKSGSLHIAGREPVRHCIDSGNNVLFIINLLESVLVIGNPAAAPQGTDCLLRLDLISGKHSGVVLIKLFLKLHIQFPEHLLKGLPDLIVK